MVVEGLLAEIAALGKQIAVEERQHGRIEACGVFHHHYALHAHLQNVVGGVEAVFYQLDDGQDEVYVAEPREHEIHAAEVFVGQAATHLACKGQQKHRRYAGVLKPQLCRFLQRGAYLHSRHHYNKVRPHIAHSLAGLTEIRYLDKAGGAAQVQVGIFFVNLLFHAPVFLQHKGVVGRGYEQHIVHAPLHKILKRCFVQRHRLRARGVVILHSKEDKK